MIFDWKNGKQEALKNGIYEKNIYSCTRVMMKAEGRVVANHTFRNFETLEFEDGTLIVNCVFEDCDHITFDECRVEGCTFSRIEMIFSVDSTFTNSNFNELHCNDEMIISLEDSEICHCNFENIELHDDSYLCDGVGSSWIEHCSFSNVRTSREDRQIIICEKVVGKIFKRKEELCIVDNSSCTGLSDVIYIGEE